MPAERGTRKLAAIMFTDIKSFSKKMAENEEIAMELLRVHDDTLKAVIEKYDGKIIKAIGDAFMVDFSSAVNAVKCAIEAQEEFYRYNEGKVELEKIEVRIGIHLGDVITDGNDIFGDGVNIAARIEAVTEANRICISQDVYSQIKNKMQVETFHMGSIDLKNIPEPVEVYEILLSSIPEFSTPSKTAQQMPSRRATEKATKREAKEAEKIEVAKKKADEERQKAEKETQEKIGKLYTKAETLVNEGKLEEAEEQISEIFKHVAFHAGAQVLQGRIEEERERKADEDRKSQAAKRKAKQRITELMQEALTMVEGDNYSEAILKVREVLSLDEANEEARKLEKQIVEAQAAIEELELREAREGTEETEEAEETPEEESVEVSEPQKSDQPREQAPPVRPSVGLRRRKPRRKVSQGTITMVGVIIVLALVVLFFPNLRKAFFPQDTSIVVAPFTFSPGTADTANLGGALAQILAEDLSAYGELVVVRLRGDGNNRVSPREWAEQLQVRYVLSGIVRSLSPRVVIDLKLQIADMNATAWENTVEGEAFVLSGVRSRAVSNVLEIMELEVQPRELSRLSSNSFLNEPYLRSLSLVSGTSYESLLQGISLLRQIVQFDSTFASAYTALGRALLRQFRIEGEQNKTLLREAVDMAIKARGLDPNLPAAYEVLGSAYRAAGRFSSSLGSLQRSQDLQPGNPETLRQLALLALIEGRYDRGLEQASKAILLDPKSPESHETLGHMYYFKQQFPRALAEYDQAIAYGANPFFVTTKYKLAAWAAGINAEPAAEYCQRLLRQDTSNYILKYWIGRAYMISGQWNQAKGFLESGAEYLKEIVKEYPNDAEVRSYLALYHARLGESANGLTEIDKALELTNQSPLMMYRKAQFFAIQPGKQEEALEWLRRAVDQEFVLAEVMNPDFAFVVKEPQFLEAISISIPPPGQE